MSDLKTQTAPAAADTGLPLFYSKPEALNPIRHG
ncbi:SapC family protein, partial [Mesorhizobium sp. M4B.F.Ca.ET.089.01.1.1]